MLPLLFILKTEYLNKCNGILNDMRVIKRKNYYYLQHTYRKDKKVVCKELYLGKSIPKDIDEIKEKLLRKTQGRELFQKFDKIKKNYQKQWKKYPKSIKEKIKKQLIVDFTYNSNAIEGSTITKDETEEIIERKIAPNKPLNDIQETINHAKVFEKILDDCYNDISLKLVRDWHLEIFKQSKPDIAGEIREYLVRVGDYVCPDWQDLPKLLREFFVWYNKNKKMHPIELAAKAHYKFVRIHPFGDGNGRISRLIMNFILHKHGFPVLVIEYKKRISYYKALRKADKKTEYEFLKYFYRRYLSYCKKYV